MNLKKCENGHFYDTDKYASCPHCAKSGRKEKDIVTEALNVNTDIRGNRGDVITEDLFSVEQPTENDMHTEKTPAQSVNPSIFEVKTEENRTVGYYSRVIGTEPVVGWLVCTEGEYFGESFKLKSGRNFIGRSSGMDVVLSADMGVSRSKHAIVIYEPRKRIFIAQPGESRELFYLNDEVVLSNVQMKAYDTLSVGTTKLMLIPCCGEKFSWEDVKKED